MLKDKTIVLGITGGIACYKIANLASALVKQHADVIVIMTENATKFISPLVFEEFTGNKTYVDTFDRNFTHNVEHISIADRADFVLIAPATANVLAKLANGIADDMLTTTVLACDCPKAVSPSMNTKMLENPITQRNIKTLSEYGFEIVEPASGRLACGAVGKGKMPEPDELLEVITHGCSHKKDMQGLSVVVTAGPTREAIDPVRYITNHSSGKMGIAVAKCAAARGADVTLICGQTDIKLPLYCKNVSVISAEDMYNAVTENEKTADIIIMAAAVADYRPASIADNKIKKKDADMSIPLVRTKDILKTLGENKREGLYLCGFSMETENLIENSRKKLISKNLDMIAANSIKTEGSGFRGDTNVLTLIGKDFETELPLMSKEAAADCLLDNIMKNFTK